MIFIIIAVVVLFVSFVIALFSLVREQKKIDMVEKSGVSEQIEAEPVVLNTPVADDLVSGGQKSTAVPTEVANQANEPQPLVEDQERFPWPVEPTVLSGENSEQDEIEKIRAEIARLKKPEEGKQEMQIIKENKIEPQISSEVDRLNGEFQIRRED